MRYQLPAAIVCDGCGRPGDGARQVTVVPGPQGPLNLERVLLPDKWVSAIIHPTLALARMPDGLDPFAHNATELARLSGTPIEAAFCGACKTKATSKRIVGEAIEAAAAPDPEAERVAAEERAKRDAEAEAAERAAFEAKRTRELAPDAAS
jgi:hypothetical protein